SKETPLVGWCQPGLHPGQQGGPQGSRCARPAVRSVVAEEDQVVEGRAGQGRDVRHDAAVDAPLVQGGHGDGLPGRAVELGADPAAGGPAASHGPVAGRVPPHDLFGGVPSSMVPPTLRTNGLVAGKFTCALWSSTWSPTPSSPDETQVVTPSIDA